MSENNNFSIENVSYVINNSVTEYKNIHKQKNPLQRVVLPKYLDQLDKSKIVNRIIIEMFQFHILLFIIVYIFLHIVVSPLFNTNKLKRVQDLFLISLITSIYYYMNNVGKWNHYIVSNIITSLVAYIVITYFSQYFNYFITQIFIIIISFIVMMIFNSTHISALAYGLIGYSLVDKIGLDGYVFKWIIYVITSFFILKLVIYLNNLLFTYINNQSTNHK